MLDTALSLAPLSAQIWLVQMTAYHGIGLWFEWLDRTGGLKRFKVKRLERMSYFEILPRVLANQTFILLPAMLFMQWSGLAYRRLAAGVAPGLRRKRRLHDPWS